MLKGFRIFIFCLPNTERLNERLNTHTNWIWLNDNRFSVYIIIRVISVHMRSLANYIVTVWINFKIINSKPFVRIYDLIYWHMRNIQIPYNANASNRCGSKNIFKFIMSIGNFRINYIIPGFTYHPLLQFL